MSRASGLQSGALAAVASSRFIKSSRAKSPSLSKSRSQATAANNSSPNLSQPNVSNYSSNREVDITTTDPNRKILGNASPGTKANKSTSNSQFSNSLKEIVDLMIFCHSSNDNEVDINLTTKNILSIYNFIKGNPSAQENLYNLGAYILATHLLLKYINSSEISEILLAITYSLYRQGYPQLLQTASPYINNLRPITATEVIVNVMRQQISKSAVLLQGCRNVTQLSFNNIAVQDELCRLGICPVIIAAFDKYLNSEDVVQQLCLVVITLSFNNPFSQRSLLDAGICTKIILSLEKYLSNSEALLQILWAMRNLSHNNLEFCIQCGSQGACELLLVVLRNNRSNLRLVEHCLALVGNLANENPVNQMKFGVAGTCELLIHQLKYFNDHNSALELSLVAIIELAKLLENRLKFVNREVVEIYATNHDNSYFMEVWCKLIGDLCVDGDEVIGKLGIMGACGGVISAIQTHSSNIDCFKSACQALALLSSNDDNCSRFGRGGVSKYLTTVLASCQDREDNLPIIDVVFHAVNLLCSDKGFQKQVFDEGMEIIVVKILKLFAINKPILESGSSILTKLASNNVDSESKLLKAGACEAILKITSIYSDNESITAFACDTIASMCFENSEAAKRFGEVGICENMMKLLNNFKNNAESLLKLLWSVENLVTHIEENQEKFYQLGLHPLLLKLCQRFDQNEEVVEHIFRVIFLLTSDKNSENFKRFNGNVLCDITFDILNKYANNIDIVEYCCYVVSNLSSVKEYVMKLYDAGVYKVLLVILDNNFVNTRVMESCCWAISNLFRERNKVIDSYDKSETCKLMIKILNDSKSPTKVVAKACEVIADVYLDKENRSKLGLIASFEALRQVLKQYIDIEEVVYSGCFALLRLICYSSSNTDKFWKEGGQEILLSVMNHHEMNPRIVERILFCFSSIFENSGGALSISSADILETVSSCMYFNMKNAEIVKQGIVVLSFAVDTYTNHLSSEINVKQKPFGACDLIVKLLVANIRDRFIVESGLRSIALVCNNSMENKHAFFKVDVCNLVINTLDVHMADSGIIESTCWVICKLCDNFLNAKISLGTRCCELLVTAVGQHNKYSSVVMMVFEAMLCISEHSENKKQFDCTPLFEIVLRTLKYHREHGGTIEKCCKIITMVAGGSKGDTRYLRFNICDAILKALDFHTYSVKIVMQICEALIILIQCDRDDYRLIFRDLKGCNSLISALNNHVNDEEVVKLGLDTLEVVSLNCRENKLDLVTNGLFELLNIILLQFGTPQSSSASPASKAAIVLQGLKLMSTVSSSSALLQNKFQESRAVRGLMSALAGNISNPVAMMHGSNCIYLLTVHNLETQRLFADNSACEILVGALFRHLSVQDTVKSILAAVGSLSSDVPEIVAKLGEVGICEMTIKALKVFKANPEIAEHALLVVSNCCFGNVQNTLKFSRSGAVFNVLRTLELFILVPKIVGYSWGAVINLCCSVPSIRRELVKDGIVKHLMQVLSTFAGDESIMELSFRVLSSLTDGVIENREVVAKEDGICLILSSGINAHIADSRVLLYAFQAVNSAQLYASLALLDFDEYEGLVGSIRIAMESHSTDDEIQKLGRRILSKYTAPLTNPGGSSNNIFSCCFSHR